MKTGIRPWTAQEDADALALKRQGKRPPEIADALNRTRGAVSARFRYLSLSAEARLQQSRAKRNKTKRTLPVVRERMAPSSIRFIPPEVLADRERRQLAPQPNFGDPPLGYSALDRRQSGVSA